MSPATPQQSARAARRNGQNRIFGKRSIIHFLEKGKPAICERNAIPPSSRDQTRKPNQTEEKEPTKTAPAQKDVIVDNVNFFRNVT